MRAHTCVEGLHRPPLTQVLRTDAQEFRSQRDAEKESINDDVVFEIELIKQVEINVDYILMLVERFRDAKGDGDDKEIRSAIERAVDSSPSLRKAAFRDGAVQPTGTAITKILPPVSRFAKAGGHSAKKRTVLQKLGDFFDRFFGLS